MYFESSYHDVMILIFTLFFVWAEKKRERENEDNSTKEDNKEERKRKRRSRWGDPDNKVPISEINTITTHSKQQSSGSFSQPGIAIPGQIGQPAVIIPPPKVQRTETKNPMLTKISRNDPALIQYARQTFGTLDLTEEQWKKAEDHYKVIKLNIKFDLKFIILIKFLESYRLIFHYNLYLDKSSISKFIKKTRRSKTFGSTG